MKSFNRPFKFHILVCTNTRPAGGKPSCASGSSKSLVHKFQMSILSHNELKGKILVSGTSCLGFCFDGPNVVIYPNGNWYQNVNISDVDELIESHFIKNTPLKRLLADFPNSP